MLLGLVITISSFKIIKSEIDVMNYPAKSVVIHNSNFINLHSFFKNKDAEHKANKISNALISNSNFRFNNANDHLMLFNQVNLNDTVFELDEDYDTSPIVYQAGKNLIYNLTLVGFQYKDNNEAIFSFDSADIEIEQLKFKGKTQATLFKGKITRFSLTDSTIEGFSKDDTHDIRSAIFLDHILSTDGSVKLIFNNNTYQDNNIPVFELSKTKLTNNVTISTSFFKRNSASSGSCILLSANSVTDDKFIIIDNNTFSENENIGNTGTIAGALKVNTQQAIFTGENYFYKNSVMYNGDLEESSGSHGGSIYLTHSIRQVPYLYIVEMKESRVQKVTML